MNAVEAAAKITPSERQLKWQDTEFYALIYYGMNTFTKKDIGEGFSVPETFCPENIDVDSWAQTVRDGGMNGMLITAKHYDGFCSWQTKTTDYSVGSSNWMGGKGDLVKLAADAARKYSLKFGLYIPIWDRHEPSFRKSDGSFNSFFIAQLEELLTSYGEIFEIHLDDRVDEEMRFELDYGRVYKTIRRLQPNCSIVSRGPDGRWVGNDRGVTRKNEWSVVPACYGYGENGEELTSKKVRKFGVMENDIASRKAIKKEDEFIWYPCEVNFDMRKHRFYRKDDDYTLKTKDKILDIYYRAVGGNSNLMLTLSPTPGGKLHETDTQILKAVGNDLKVIFGFNLAEEATTKSSSELSELYKAKNVLTDDESFWCPIADDKKPYIKVEFSKRQVFDKIVLKEHIRSGQRVEKFTVYVCADEKEKWKKFIEGGVIGRKRICPCKPMEALKIKIVFDEYRASPEISYIQIN